jgi:hypothetical protein
MSPGDKAICQEHAREIIKEVIKEHIQSCPHGRSLLKFACISIGIAIGSGIASGSVVLAVFKFVIGGN